MSDERKTGPTICSGCKKPAHYGGCRFPDLPKESIGQFVPATESEGMKEWKLSGRDPATYSKCGVSTCEEPKRVDGPFCTHHTTHAAGNARANAIANSRQVGGDHYMKQAIQPWDYIVANKIGFLAGCAIKYISRYDSPGAGGIRDLEKAKHFLEKLIEVETQEIKDRGEDKL